MHFQDRFEDRAEAALRCAASSAVRSSTWRLQFELGLLGDGDVARDPDEADQFPVRPEARLRHAAQPAIFAVAAPIARLERERLQRRLAGDALGDDPVDVVGVDPRPPVERLRILARSARAKSI